VGVIGALLLILGVFALLIEATKDEERQADETFREESPSAR
jgi:hypothetical protein